MSSINYSLNHKGVRLIGANNAWVIGKNGVKRLNPNYHFVGKIEMTMPNMIISATDNKKPKYKGNTYDLNRKSKEQIVDHFYDNNGKRNKKTVAYLAVEKKK